MKDLNPYVEARREWNDRYLDLVQARRWWQIAAVAELAPAGLLGGGSLALGPQPQHVPDRRQGPRREQLGGLAEGGDGAPRHGRRHPDEPLRAVREGDPMDQAALSQTASGAAARAALGAALALLAGCATQPAPTAPLDEDLVRATAVPEKTELDRKSTRLNSSHSQISYAVFCLKKKKR